jgi:hypothetical protein
MALSQADVNHFLNQNVVIMTIPARYYGLVHNVTTTGVTLTNRTGFYNNNGQRDPSVATELNLTPLTIGGNSSVPNVPYWGQDPYIYLDYAYSWSTRTNNTVISLTDIISIQVY